MRLWAGLKQIKINDMSSYTKYLKRPNTPMPKEHLDILEKGQEVSDDLMLPLKEINQLFKTGYLKGENGFRRNEDGSVYAAILTKMPKVKIEMLDWWFWWHAAEDIRYQIWYPDMHFAISADFQGHYNNDSKSYRERLHLSSHLVTENVGTGKEKILIDFMNPADFGFDETKLDPKKMTIICARVGSTDRGVWGTKMCHFVRTTDEGVEMRSRFWIGHQVERMGGFAQDFLNSILNKPFVKRKLIPKGLGKAMFHHCSQEYCNLREILPQLYKEKI